mgnify:CR=1 FL=1
MQNNPAKDTERPVTYLFTLCDGYTQGATPDPLPSKPWRMNRVPRRQKVLDMAKEARAMIKKSSATREELKSFFSSLTRVLQDRLNNNVLKQHWINVGSCNPTALCGYLFCEKPAQVSFRTKKILVDNTRTPSPYVVITFRSKVAMPNLLYDYKSKSFDFCGIPHRNEYKVLKFSVDNYGRVRLYFQQKSRALIDGEWLIVP